MGKPPQTIVLFHEDLYGRLNRANPFQEVTDGISITWKTLGQAIAQSVYAMGNDQGCADEWAADLLEITHRNQLDIFVEIECFEYLTLGIGYGLRVCRLVKRGLNRQGSSVLVATVVLPDTVVVPAMVALPAILPRQAAPLPMQRKSNS